MTRIIHQQDGGDRKAKPPESGMWICINLSPSRSSFVKQLIRKRWGKSVFF